MRILCVKYAKLAFKILNSLFLEKTDIFNYDYKVVANVNMEEPMNLSNDILHLADNEENEKSYQMNFSENDNSNDNQPNNKNKNSGNTNNRGYLSVVILALAFIVIIVLMLYFFVFRSSTTTLYYYNDDVVYRIDTDHDGDPEMTQTGTPDFSTVTGDNTYSIYDADTNPDGIIMSDYLGELAYFMLTPETSNITVTGILSNTDSRLIYLTGTFIYTSSTGTTVSYAYQAQIDYDIYQAYVIPLINNVTIPNSDGTVSLYYTGYQYGIESSSSLSSWLFPLILAILVIALIFFFFNRMSKSIGSGSGSMAGFAGNVARKETTSKVRFADVAGCDEAKAELVEMVDYFHSTDKYTRLGAKLPHGVLLVGPPGTGKTLLAKAVAGEASVPFFSISGSDFVEMYVGVGASRVRSLFKTAKASAPCLIFIDEIDAVGRQRGAGLGGGNDEREQTLNQLLVEMDGFSDNNGIIVMAATNRSDVLDPALTRPGRFDRTITVDLPDKQGRAAILRVHSRNKKLDPAIDFDVIASRTVGFSGADLANIMNDAAILAVRANRTAITTADIDEAIDRAISGPAKKSHLESEEKKQVAYHEAGHAVIGIFLPYSDKVQKITIIPRGRTGGHVLMTPEKDRFLLTKNQMLARITGYLGGRTSEEIFFGDVSTGASNDIEVATNLARAMVTQYGMSDLGPVMYEKPGGSVFLGRDYTSTQANYSTQTALEIDKAVRSIIDECHEKANALLTEHEDDVKLIAETLIEHETITADQIDYLLKNRELPPVDEHKMTAVNGTDIKNPNNIVLYPGYDEFYIAVDKLLTSNPSRLVIVFSTNAHKIDDDEFKKACIRGAQDPSRIAILLIDRAQTSHINITIESFAEHLETYAGTPVLLIKTDESSVLRLKNMNQPAKTQERPGVVKEILPSDREKQPEETEENNTETPLLTETDETSTDEDSDEDDQGNKEI